VAHKLITNDRCDGSESISTNISCKLYSGSGVIKPKQSVTLISYHCFGKIDIVKSAINENDLTMWDDFFLGAVFSQQDRYILKDLNVLESDSIMAENRCALNIDWSMQEISSISLCNF